MPEELPECVENNLFSNHFLKERITEMDEWDAEVEEEFDQLKSILEENKDILEQGIGEAETQRKFIDKVLEEVLGHYFVTEQSKRFSGVLLNPDYLFLESKEKHNEIDSSDDKDEFTESYIVGDAKEWGAPLDRGGTDHTNPAYQIYNYVDRSRIKWGILTNGQKWRLYCYEDCAADTYYEVDLIQLLSSPRDKEEILEEFKYFLLFFRKQSFFPEGDGFVDRVFEQSITYAEQLEDDLEDEVYDSLELAVKGFFDTNDLEKTDENIELVHHASLILLYRILFILNAESRGLLPVEDEAYYQAYGITQLKEFLLDNPEERNIFKSNTRLWDKRISRLFEGINEGYSGLDKEEIPAYNGGLFDPDYSDAHKFLEENKLSGVYLKEILQSLATTRDEEKDDRVTVDYRDLNIRHLGSVYEGLLEHEFEKATERKVLEAGEWTELSDSDRDWEDYDEDSQVEEGELYLTNESGERKATGSYYTPEYIVEYIVENTVGPKVEEKVEEAEENGDKVLTKILELNVCDPAMGSGHFLTEATEFIAEKIVEKAELEEEDIDDRNELTWAKRQVVQNCIYGVDINPLAVELAKLSLWIETMSSGKPLSFLDHHLKTGNSLIGSDLEELDFHPGVEERPDSEKDFDEIFDVETVREGLRNKYREIEELPENTLEEIKEKEESYKQFIENHEAYRQFKQLSNIHTHQLFESMLSPKQYREISKDIMTTDWIGHHGEDWFQGAQEDARDCYYFHWQLEFPKVFFGENQGFDAVIGNPPYISTSAIPQDIRDYLREVSTTVGKEMDTFSIFYEFLLQKTKTGGNIGFILPDSFLQMDSYRGFRDFVLRKNIVYIATVSQGAFDDAEVGHSVVLLVQNSSDISPVVIHELNKQGDIVKEDVIEQRYFKKLPNHSLLLDSKKIDLILSFQEFPPLKEFVELRAGIKTGNISEYVRRGEDGEKWMKTLSGGDIEKYQIRYSGDRVLYDDEKLSAAREEWIFTTAPKVLIRETSSHPVAVVDEEQYYVQDTVQILFCEDNWGPYQITAVLNSRLIAGLWYMMIPHASRSFAKVKLSALEKLPFPPETMAQTDLGKQLEEASRKLHRLYKDKLSEKESFLSWISQEWGVEIGDLSLKTHLRDYWEYDFDEMLRIAKKNKSQIDGDPSRRAFQEQLKEEWQKSMDSLHPLQEDISELEREIDACVFRLYDLTAEEIETVLDSLDTSEGEKRAILEKFRGID